MVIAEFEVDHLVLEFEYSAHHSVQHVTKDATLLRVNDLVVGQLQTPEDLNVLDVHGRQQLERRNSILDARATRLYLAVLNTTD